MPMPTMKKAYGSQHRCCTDEQLFEMLKELRQKEAEEKKSAALCDFPGNIAAGYGHILSHHARRTGKMPGRKQGKALKYGKPFVELIAQICGRK